MKKSFTKLYLIAALVLTTGLAFVGCKDYDDDIDNLQKQITENAAAIKKVQDLIDGGSVITNVASTTNGIVITLSNGATHTITNGTNGTNGTDGTVVSIGLDGYWYIGTTKTEYQAHGATGDTGAIGETGANGKNGDYYIPEADGYWYKVDGETGTKTNTNISWAVAQDGAITAAWDAENGILTLMGVPGYADGLALVIYNNSALLRSLVFVPQVSVNGVSSIDFSDFRYTPYDKATDKTKTSATEVTITPEVVAEYHMNPTTASATYLDLENLEFVYKGVAIRSSSIEAKAAFEEIAGGLLRVNVKVNSAFIDNYRENRSNTNPSTITNLDMIALQVPIDEDGDGTTEGTVTSDYAGLYSTTYNFVKIVQPWVKDGTNYAGIQNIGTTDNCYTYHTYFNGTRNSASHVQMNIAQGYHTSIGNTPSNATLPRDAEMVYDDEMDLSTLVATYNNHCQEFDVEETFGLKFKFEIPTGDEVYMVDNTDQQAFGKIEIVDGKYIFKTKTYNVDESLQSAVGRSPIVRAILYDPANNDEIVKIAYIKIKITDKEIKPTPKVIDLATFYQKPCAGITLETTAKQMNEQLYAKLQAEGISKELFHQIYTIKKNGGNVVLANTTDNGTVIEYAPAGDRTTYTLKWVLSSTEVGTITSPSDSLSATVTYESSISTYGAVTITLKAQTIGIDTDIKMAAKFAEGQLWSLDGTYVSYTVDAPTTGPLDVATNCLFQNKSLAAPWDANNGIINLDFKDVPFIYVDGNGTNGEYATDYPNSTNYVADFWGIYTKGITAFSDGANAEIKYRFAEVQPATTVEVTDIFGIKTTYTISTSVDQSKLLATGGGVTDQVVATVTNTTFSLGAMSYGADGTAANTGDVAKILLNTDAFYANIETYLVTSCNEVVPIKDGTYKVKFVRPLKVTTLTGKSFSHPKDKNTNVINILNVLQLVDWRGTIVSSPATYWDFYGLTTYTSITAYPAKATTSLTDGKQITGVNFAYDATSGNLTYDGTASSIKLNGAYYLNVPVTVNYLWGTVEGTITITVNP